MRRLSIAFAVVLGACGDSGTTGTGAGDTGGSGGSTDGGGGSSSASGGVITVVQPNGQIFLYDNLLRFLRVQNP